MSQDGLVRWYGGGATRVESAESEWPKFDAGMKFFSCFSDIEIWSVQWSVVHDTKFEPVFLHPCMRPSFFHACADHIDYIHGLFFLQYAKQTKGYSSS